MTTQLDLFSQWVVATDGGGFASWAAESVTQDSATPEEPAPVDVIQDVEQPDALECVTLVWNERFGLGTLTGTFVVTGGMRRWVRHNIEEAIAEAKAGGAGWLRADLWDKERAE